MATIREVNALLNATPEPYVLRSGEIRDAADRKMRVIYADREPVEIPYCATSMSDVLIKKYDPESTVIDYEIDGWDY